MKYLYYIGKNGQAGRGFLEGRGTSWYCVVAPHVWCLRMMRVIGSVGSGARFVEIGDATIYTSDDTISILMPTLCSGGSQVCCFI